MQTEQLSEEPKQKQGRGLIDSNLVEAPSYFIAGLPKVALLFSFFSDFRFGVWLFFVILVRCKNRKNVKIDVKWQASRYGKWLFTWLSLVMPLMVSYSVLSFFPGDVLDEIWTELNQFLRIFLPTFT